MLVLATCWAGIIAHRIITKQENLHRLTRGVHAASVTTVVVVGIFGVLLWTYPLKTTPYHEPLLSAAARGFFGNTGVDAQFSMFSMSELSKEFSYMTSTPDYRRDERYFAKAENFDIVYFILNQFFMGK